jgi:hypothetical protein
MNSLALAAALSIVVAVGAQISAMQHAALMAVYDAIGLLMIEY